MTQDPTDPPIHPGEPSGGQPGGQPGAWSPYEPPGQPVTPPPAPWRPPGAYAPQPFGTPSWLPPRDHPQASTALGLGVGSLVGLFVCFLPALLGPFAWYIGAKAVREIDAAPQQYGGRGTALAGMITGIVSTVLLVLSVVAVVVIVVVVASADT